MAISENIDPTVARAICMRQTLLDHPRPGGCFSLGAPTLRTRESIVLAFYFRFLDRSSPLRRCSYSKRFHHGIATIETQREKQTERRRLRESAGSANLRAGGRPGRRRRRPRSCPCRSYYIVILSANKADRLRVHDDARQFPYIFSKVNRARRAEALTARHDSRDTCAPRDVAT